MQNRRIQLIIAAIIIAVVGLSAIQIYWINNEVALESRRFDRAVYDALGSSGRKIEKLSMLCCVNNGDPCNANQSTVGAMIQEQHKIAQMMFANDSNALKAMQRQNNLMQDLVNDMMGGVRQMDYSKIDSNTIQKILNTEFQIRGIDTRFYYAFGNFNKGGYNMVSHPGHFDKIARSPYQMVLFSGNVFSPPTYLIVFFPSKGVFLLQSIWVTLFVSFLFLGVIVFAFYYSFKTIFSQKKLSDIKTDFINNVTHELKTPVATLSLVGETLSSESVRHDSDKVSRYAKMVKDESKRLQTMIETILTTAITEKDNFKINKQTININRLMADIIARGQLPLEQVNGRIIYNENVKEVIANVDYLHLSNALYNIIDNAIKYCDKTPEIVISLDATPADFTVTIKDNGIGISKDNLDRVFDSMYRVPTGNVHNVKGFGLGLSYCKNIIEKHKGTIKIDSKEGEGTTFIINLPIII